MNSKKILICDDDEGILDMLSLLLEESGFETLPLTNSLLIFDTIRQQQPDLVLLDLWMPVLSGDQVLRTLRKNNETHHLPVIVISASREGQTIAAEAGADDYVAKPFDLELLLSKVKALTLGAN